MSARTQQHFRAKLAATLAGPLVPYYQRPVRRPPSERLLGRSVEVEVELEVDELAMAALRAADAILERCGLKQRPAPAPAPRERDGMLIAFNVVAADDDELEYEVRLAGGEGWTVPHAGKVLVPGGEPLDIVAGDRVEVTPTGCIVVRKEYR